MLYLLINKNHTGAEKLFFYFIGQVFLIFPMISTPNVHILYTLYKEEKGLGHSQVNPLLI